MALNLVSPGVKVREVDLTIGRVDDISDQVGAIAGPFAKGPVNVPILVETEQDLLNTFGKPYSADDQYEYWYTASSYLSYGGVLRVIRADAPTLSNSNSPVGVAVTTLKITSSEDYFNNHTSDSDWYYASRNPGSWANDLKVCVIDALADQRLAIGTDGLVVGWAITAGFSTNYAKSDGTVGVSTGFIKGMITKINKGSVDVKVISTYDNSTNTWTSVNYEEGSGITAFQGYDTKFAIGLGTDQGNFENRYRIYNASGTEQRIERYRFNANVGAGSTIITLTSLDSNYVTFGDQLKSENGTYTTNVLGFGTDGTTVIVDSAAPVSFANTSFIVKTGIGTGLLLRPVNTAVDWYNEQTLGLTNATVYWKNIAPKPATSQFASERNAKHDEFHVVVVDDAGKVTGTSGNIVEKWTGLSKASDAKISPSTAIYYKEYIANGSNYIFAGAAENGVGLKFTSASGYTVDSTGAWGGQAQNTTFNAIGAKVYTLGNGNDYTSTKETFSVNLGDIVSSYAILDNPAEYSVNFLLQGPSGGASIFESQAKASKLIQIASTRKDCIACVSPHRSGVVNVSNSDQQTQSIIQFYDALPSSSYAVFDSGYKYMYDRFNNTFRYIPLNGDVAGLMARTSINAYPWYSPAGSQRGAINNAIKLAYNPSQAQRDLLYPKRINPVVFSPGAGIVLFGDKTALKEASAFDRINVRRLFLTIEQTIERAAKAQLFEFNDVLTRTNFLNIVEPYLRDVKSKRGIADFVVICDETNNTPDVIDSNQFRADIFVKPARSINYIGLTFVATRSGISFDEVIGAV